MWYQKHSCSYLCLSADIPDTLLFLNITKPAFLATGRSKEKSSLFFLKLNALDAVHTYSSSISHDADLCNSIIFFSSLFLYACKMHFTVLHSHFADSASLFVSRILFGHFDLCNLYSAMTSCTLSNSLQSASFGCI